MLFWTALKLLEHVHLKVACFRDVLFWTALKPDLGVKKVTHSFRDVLFWTALKPESTEILAKSMF